MIEIWNLGKRYISKPGILGRLRGEEAKTIPALRDIRLEVRPGELLGVLGPNGAGKTTLIKCLATLLLPDEGTARIAGFDIRTQAEEVRARIGLVSGGERTLYWKLPALDNLRYFAALYNLPAQEAQQRIWRLLGQMGLMDRANDRLENYSSGMRQKVALCRALLHDPPVLLLDEPTLGLDPGFSRYLRDFIREELSRRQKKTILLATHYLTEADHLCDRIAILHKGRLAAVDTAAGLKAKVPYKSVLELRAEGDFASVPDGAEKSVANGFTTLRLPGRLSARGEEIRAWLGEAGRLVEVRRTGPTLEDAFLHLTGERLGEAETAEACEAPPSGSAGPSWGGGTG